MRNKSQADRIDQEAFGKRLAAARSEKGLTQETFSEMVDISKNYVSDLERGKKMPSWGKMVRMSDILGVSIDYLVCDSTERGRREVEYETLEFLSVLGRSESRGVLEICKQIVRMLTKEPY